MRMPPAALLVVAVLVAILGILVSGEAGWWIVLGGVITFIAGLERAWKGRGR